jgi:anion-transporting  ArsA/GET3 family ATPase
VLLVEVEGRQGLAQLFDAPPLPYAETRLAATSRGEVFGLSVDAEAAMLEYLEMFYSIKRAGSALRKMGAIDFVTTIAPGLRDVLLTGKVKEAVTRTERSGRPSFDAVVLDAPPTGRITQFLQATHEVAGLTKVGPIHRQSQGVIELLHSDRTRVHIVTLLEEMPVQETLDAAAELRAAGYRIGQVIVNRARPVLVSADRIEEGLLAQGLTVAGLDPALAPALAAQVSDYGRRQDVQAEAAAELEQVGAPILRLPEVTPPIDLSCLFELADVLDVRVWSA